MLRRSQIFFADDTLIFGRAKIPELARVKELLEIYEVASGQVINLLKSDIMFSRGLTVEKGRRLADVLGVWWVEQHSIYLDIPARVGRARGEVFRGLINRITKKLKDWKSKTLSQAGKLALVKSVAQSIPTYLMTCFKIPSGVIQRLHSVIARFI